MSLAALQAVSCSYHDELRAAMKLLASCEDTVFVGQGMLGGTSMFSTLADVPIEKKVEFPVAEDFQMGFCAGQSLLGFLPVAVYPRWNFLLLAANQLIHTVDRLPLYSNGGYRPKVIIRTAIPSTVPFNPGPQHDDDFTDAFAMMTRTVKIVRLKEAELIVPAYRAAIESEGSTLLVEYTEYYKSQRGNV
jgi:pyruvate/2-oxoglutarate/acetoin dehydrogenase E1 component